MGVGVHRTRDGIPDCYGRNGRGTVVRHSAKGECMAWDFETEPEFEEKLAWMREFVR
ncbi:MAG: hypothetical protein RLZZ39_977, partial [Actinomycetota bacterium]